SIRDFSRPLARSCGIVGARSGQITGSDSPRSGHAGARGICGSPRVGEKIKNMILANTLLLAAEPRADDIPWGEKIMVIVTAVIMLAALLCGSVLVPRPPAPRHGKWAINGPATFCPNCDEAAPTVRKPANFQQALWGGWTCRECGCEYDKWGRRVHCPKCTAEMPVVARPKASTAANSVRATCLSCGHESTVFRL